MNDPIQAGGIVNCALFLAILSAAGIWSGSHSVVTLALGSSGTAATAYAFRAVSPMRIWSVVAAGAFGVASDGLAACGAIILVLEWFK